jgi:hypothetical protein
MAVHAAAQAGHSVLVASKARKSELFGCQYLHAPIPGATTGEPVDVAYTLQGSASDYRDKVYGGTYRGEVSPEALGAEHKAWDIRQTYDTLWDMYGSYVQDVDFSVQGSVASALEELAPDVVFGAIPAPLLCRSGDHAFHSEEIYALGDAPARGQFVEYPVPENTILCDGTGDHGWYRASRVFGHSTMEWPGKKKPPVSGVSTVTKPLATNCDCHPTVIRVGRYGKWTKGILSHEAYYEARSVLEALDGNGEQGTLF